jgi:hypothetical protein
VPRAAAGGRKHAARSTAEHARLPVAPVHGTGDCHTTPPVVTGPPGARCSVLARDVAQVLQAFTWRADSAHREI